MAGGRPTKYDDDMLAKANEYLSEPTFLPSHQELAEYLDIAPSTLYKWATEKPEFSEVLERVKNKQFTTAMRMGLNGDWNAQLVKLLMGKHGLSEKSEVDNISSDGSMATGKPTKIELVAYEAKSDE